MTSLGALCLDLFLLGHAHLAAGHAGDGFGFERRVRAHLNATGEPNPAGFRVFGRRSLSGIYHQLDEQTRCAQAAVVGEWKAYTGQIPKNELLRFKAATDDYWLSPSTRRDRPLVRLFGGTGTVTPAMRVYAAQWGIILITPDRWPIPTLIDPDLLWAPGDLPAPAARDVRALATITRPLNDILAPHANGGWQVPAIPTAADLATRFQLWQTWSDRAWAWWDDQVPARFDWLLETRTTLTAA
ncbi:hypothetical protein SFC79_06440 [Nocardioides sp. S-58]|uniref:Restriction endonuclease n=1 Tax=Nocardioides renjunii TaxID=3095075 RepID=A0ABU5KA18_9ACTN|nr:hypothetical protein [Nocardioides sp. S-58]MDZ5661400.1 hypothetical protein [Nocardioides sp. S-58]